MERERVDKNFIIVTTINAVLSWVSIISYSIALNLESSLAAVIFIAALYIPIGIILTLIFISMDIYSLISDKNDPLTKITIKPNTVALLAYIFWIILLILVLPPLTA